MLKDSAGNHIYQVIEVMPEFPGGENKLMSFIAGNLRYPERSQRNNVQGKVIVRFVVNSTGKVEKAEVVRSLDPDLDKEAIRIVNLLPIWEPGRQNGVNVSVWYTLPISFRLN
jgi:TonB family protein